ncbi:MAG: zinc-binding protein, partial [Rubrivivax sp.]|nr:zinc-binding protein [Rubrivivax sp.]
VTPTLHVQLAESGVRKAYRTDFDAAQAATLYERLAAQIRALRADADAGPHRG